MSDIIITVALADDGEHPIDFIIDDQHDRIVIHDRDVDYRLTALQAVEILDEWVRDDENIARGYTNVGSVVVLASAIDGVISFSILEPSFFGGYLTSTFPFDLRITEHPSL